MHRASLASDGMFTEYRNIVVLRETCLGSTTSSDNSTIEKPNMSRRDSYKRSSSLRYSREKDKNFDALDEKFLNDLDKMNLKTKKAEKSSKFCHYRWIIS